MTLRALNNLVGTILLGTVVAWLLMDAIPKILAEVLR